MKPRVNCFNPKRKIAVAGEFSVDARENLAKSAKYGGNPEHKRSPGDYGLTPPTSPRPGKTLCDAVRQVLKDEATELLKSGFRKGMISVQRAGAWPQNVWALSENGEVYEAQLENSNQGIYHGYPMPINDDFRIIVIREWGQR